MATILGGGPREEIQIAVLLLLLLLFISASAAASFLRVGTTRLGPP
jgi:hypothetical protein